MKALIVQGGWEGHEPELMAAFCAEKLKSEGFTVDIADSLDAFDDADSLARYQLISPCWTMGTLSPDQSANLRAAIHAGVGLGGFHGGMGDAFRGDIDYEWMVGGHFVGHPYVGNYTIELKDPTHPITEGLPSSFDYHSEQYYMMMDPGVTVLADTVYHHEGRAITMPVIWIRTWGKGRVFYSALGHKYQEFIDAPAVAQMTINGLKWAAQNL